ncbi:porphobilinogen synthase [Streptococcus danieliae]|nr:porphobilinogen synthase [Streptococcus danieliae]MBF0698452.1 porphobilinogen synthase [Streptococcus danieliae]NYS95629.1 porphobilinogen synthase [Streptococcus danieliae]
MFKRQRRLRRNPFLRDLVRETDVSLDDFIYPLFVKEGLEQPMEIPSMPGIYQFPIKDLVEEVGRCMSLGLKAFILFGIPQNKDERGSQAYAPTGIVQETLQAIKKSHPEALLIADTCLCEFTDHGHCGLLKEDDVDNDSSLELLTQVAVSQAQAGADVIAPSNAMDGFVTTIRRGLDAAGFDQVPIMAYSVKFASSFYGPFREAAEGAPQFGDRKSYQMDSANRREALREALADEDEQADFLMVKPALAYLDIIREIRGTSLLPLVAYNVSGEYAMIKAAGEKGWLNPILTRDESLLAMKRAGADLIITYFAKEIALERWKDRDGKAVK